MGQYYTLVNIDRRELVNPSHLGSGIKLWEITASNVPRVLPYLLQETDGAGGGDPIVRPSRSEFEDDDGNVDYDALHEEKRQRTEETFSLAGSWAGDRVMFLGDYSEIESDHDDFDTLYNEATESDEWTDISRQVAQEVAEFIGDDERFADMRPEVPADPDECDHRGEDEHGRENLQLMRHTPDDDTFGMWTCHKCHDSGTLETEEEWKQLKPEQPLES